MRRALVSLLLLSALAACAGKPPAKQAFVVFFHEWSAELDAEAQDVIARAAALARTSPNAVVHVTGYADPEGSVQANIELSRLRAQVVVDGLVKQGVAQDRLRRSARGPTSFALSSLESRRVEIAIGGL